MLLEYLDGPGHDARLEPAPPSARTLPAWGEAKTEIGAPSFAELQALDQRSDVDGEVDAFIESALTEHDDIPIEVACDDDDELGDIEIDVELEPEIEITIDFVTHEETLRLEVEIARESDSHIWEGLDGELGVFLATYQTLPVGTQVHVIVHVLDRVFEAPATVRWSRVENTGVWPGLGLELDEVTDEIAATIQRFGMVRPAMFHCF